MSGNVILFDSGIPSNFWVAPFWLPNPFNPVRSEKLEFKGTEWWFQAYKEFFSKRKDENNYHRIRTAKDAYKAKQLGREVPLSKDELIQWDGFTSSLVMLEGCLAKFWQNEACKMWLEGTGTATLIEHRPDRIWGDNMNGTGRNLLGHILMLVRAQIR